MSSPIITGEQLFFCRYLPLTTWLVAKRTSPGSVQGQFIKKVLSKAYAEVDKYSCDGCYFTLIMKHICKLCPKNNVKNNTPALEKISILNLLIKEGKGLDDAVQISGLNRQLLALQLRKELLTLRTFKCP